MNRAWYKPKGLKKLRYLLKGSYEYQHGIPVEVRARLVELYRDDVIALGQQFDRNLDHWLTLEGNS